VLAVTGQREAARIESGVARSILLRNPYVDPMSLIQVDLLRRKRAGEDTDEVNRAIAGTISGIARGSEILGECGGCRFPKWKTSALRPDSGTRL